MTVAVDGGPADRAVLDFAVDACRRRRVPLHIVDVVPPSGTGAGWKRAELGGARAVAAAARYACRRQPGLLVTRRVIHRRVVPALAAAGAAGVLLVVGQSWASRAVPVGTVQRLVASVRCPVVVVAGPGLPDGPVLTGPPVDRAAWRFAADEAARRRCAVVRLRRVPAGTTGRPGSAAPPAGRLPSALSSVDAAAGGRVPAAYRALDPAAPGAVAAATAGASLLVVGSAGDGPFGIRLLDTVGGRLLEAAACPLAVVGPAVQLTAWAG